MYKAQELREKSREELLQLISELKGKLLALRFENATGQLNESHLPKATKKDIALVFTILKEKELGIVFEKSKPIVKNDDSTEKVEETKMANEAETTNTVNNEETITTSNEGETN